MSPRTEEQWEEVRKRSREKILNAALVLFAEQGYHSTPISAIAQKAGVAKGLVYNYFASKEEMLLAIFDEGWAKAEATMAVIMQSDIAPYEALKLMFDATIAMLRQETTFWRLFMASFTQMYALPTIHERLLATYRESVQSIGMLLTAMGVKNAEIEAQKLGALLDGVMLHCLYVNENYPAEAVLESVLQQYTLQGQ